MPDTHTEGAEDIPKQDPRRPRRSSRIYLAVLLAPGAVIALSIAGMWLFSVNEFKAPPAGVVPTPAGYNVLGTDTDGGSGGIVVRWVFIDPPDGVTVEQGILAIQEVMTSDGWETSTSRQAPAPSGRFGLMQRNDEWAAFESAETFSSWEFVRAELRALNTSGVELIIVRLEYTDSGVGRRLLFD